jgi:hypothetical protein
MDLASQVLKPYDPGQEVLIRGTGTDATVVAQTVVFVLNGKIIRDPAQNEKLVKSLMPTLEQRNIKMGEPAKVQNGDKITMIKMYKGYVINVNSKEQVYADYELAKSIGNIAVRFGQEQHKALMKAVALEPGLNVVTGLRPDSVLGGGRTHLKHKRSHTKHRNAKRNKRVSKKKSRHTKKIR